MNFWAQFRSLFPDQPLLIGTVTEVYEATGASLITLLDGGTLMARGTSVPQGSKAFVRNGVIENPAPDLEDGDIPI